MLTRERQATIRQRIDGDGRVVATELAREFGVSEDTIRRDLREMAESGLCDRVYGGALAPAKARSMAERMALDLPQKQALGRAAAALLPDGATVFIDAGSTNAAVAQAIPDRAALTVVTNAPGIAVALLGKPGVELILLGGRVDRDAGAVIGARAVTELAALTFDVCVLGACGVREGTGLMAFDYEEAAFKQAVAARSGRVIAPVTREKFHTDARFTVMPFSERLHLVVEADIADGILAPAVAGKAQIHRSRERVKR